METSEKTDFVDDYGKDRSSLTNERKGLQEGGWQAVAISGVSGILMGAGATYATEAFASTERDNVHEEPGKENMEADNANSGASPAGDVVTSESHTTANGVHIASVDQSLSFGQAFAEARAEVGPGGVFHWHGGVFNTYYLDEWNKMSSVERASFAMQVQPEIHVKPENITVQGEGSNIHIHVHIHPEPDTPEHVDPIDPDEPTPEIHYFGFDKIDIEGQEYMAGHMTGNGEHIYLVDLEKDPGHIFEGAIADSNEDGKFTVDEIEDIREFHISIEDFAALSANEGVIESPTGNATGLSHIALNTQEGIAPGLPDYMEDANPLM